MNISSSLPSYASNPASLKSGGLAKPVGVAGEAGAVRPALEPAAAADAAPLPVVSPGQPQDLTVSTEVFVTLGSLGDLDGNGDGSVDAEEFGLDANDPDGIAMFDAVDTNTDGTLDGGEIQRFDAVLAQGYLQVAVGASDDGAGGLSLLA